MLINSENSNDIFWDESSAYFFSDKEASVLIKKMQKTVTMVKEATGFLASNEWGTCGFPSKVFTEMKSSYDAGEIDFISRYDFAYYGNNDIRLINIEAEAPRFLIETSQTQRIWLNDTMKDSVLNAEVAQVNSISELIIKALTVLYENSEYGVLHIANDNDNNWVSSAFLYGLAEIAGWNVGLLKKEEILWSGQDNYWMDSDLNPIVDLYKQFSWDKILRLPSGKKFLETDNRFELLLEPYWKMLASNRMALAALTHLYPDSDLLLKHKFNDSKGLGEKVIIRGRNPWELYSQVLKNGEKFYFSDHEKAKNLNGKSDLIFGEFVPPKPFTDSNKVNRYPFLSAYTVAGRVAGIGITEFGRPLFGKYGMFKPHFVKI